MAEDQTQEKQDQKVKQPPKKALAHRKKITFNLRFTLILLATVGVFGVGVHFLHAFQIDRNADSLLSKARRSLADENLDEAKYLRVYIGFRPKDAKAVAELAQILDRKARTGVQLVNAYRTYQEALRLDSERERIYYSALLKLLDSSVEIRMPWQELRSYARIHRRIRSSVCSLQNVI